MPKKITENMLKWYGHVKRRDEGASGKKNVRCTRTRNETERKPRWKDSCRRDMESVGLKKEDALDTQTGIMIFNTIPVSRKLLRTVE